MHNYSLKSKLLIACLFAFLLYAAASGNTSIYAEPVQIHSTGSIPQQWDNGKILVKFSQETSKEDIQLFIEKHGCETIRKIDQLNIYNLKLPDTLEVTNAIKLFYKDKSVVFAQPSYIYTAP